MPFDIMAEPDAWQWEFAYDNPDRIRDWFDWTVAYAAKTRRELPVVKAMRDEATTLEAQQYYGNGVAALEASLRELPAQIVRMFTVTLKLKEPVQSTAVNAFLDNPETGPYVRTALRRLSTCGG